MSTSSTDARVPLREKIGYGLGDAAINVLYAAFGLLLNFYVDVMGIAAAAIGTMFFVSRIFDAGTDVAMGSIADRTRTRWGCYRPYLLWGAVPFGLLGFAVFAAPPLPGDMKLVYAYVTYNAMLLAFTIVSIPYSSLLGVMTTDSRERTSFSSYRFVFAFSMMVLINGLVLPLVRILGDGNDAQGYRLTFAIFATASIALWITSFNLVRERVPPLAKKNGRIRDDLKVLVQNRAWLVLVASGLATTLNLAIRGGVTLFFLKACVVDSNKHVIWIFDRTSFFFLCGTIALAISASFSRGLVDRFEKRTAMITCKMLNAVCMFSFFFIPPDQYWTMFVVNILGNLAAGPSSPILWSMFADIADDAECRSGRRVTGLTYSASGFINKMATALGSGISGWVLGMAGYLAGRAAIDQPSSAIEAIRVLYSIAPGTLAIISTVLIFWYPLTHRRMREIETELKARRFADSTTAQPPAAVR